MSDEPKDEITILNTADEIRAAMEIEREKRFSEEAIHAAVQEFTEKTGFQDNIFSADELSKFVKGDVTADSLEKAFEERLAWQMPMHQLKRYLEITKDK